MGKNNKQEHVVEDYHREHQLKVLGEVDHSGDGQGDDHHHRAEHDPGFAPTKAGQFDQVNQRRPGPFERPGQEQGGDKDANLLERELLLAHDRHHRGGGKAVGYTLGDIEQAKGKKPAIGGIE